VINASNVDVFINNGNGFDAPVSYPAGAAPASMQVIDINKDGRRDLVIADKDGEQVVVLLGNGNGTFQPARFSPVSQPPSGVVAGDFNRDGKLDVAVACEKSVQILLGRGDGTFTHGATYSAASGVYGLIQTDLRHDDKQDLLFTDSQLLWLMYGNGDGSFQAPVLYKVGPNPVSVAVGDFNEDGAPDVVIADAQSTALTLLFNLGGTRISLKSSAGSVHPGQAVTFTATVTASVAGAPVPTGTVAFKDGPKGIGFVHLSNGTATFTTSALSSGTHPMTASYWETTSFNPHVSSPITVNIAP
jgi:hypothetical protein